MTAKNMTFATERAQTRLARILELLGTKPQTTAEIALAVHISKRWAYPYVNHLYGKHQVYVADWRINRQGGDHSPVFAAGDQADVPKPPGRDWLVKAREQRAKINADPEQRDLYLSKKRAAGRKIKGDPLHAWIPRRGAAA